MNCPVIAAEGIESHDVPVLGAVLVQRSVLAGLVYHHVLCFHLPVAVCATCRGGL